MISIVYFVMMFSMRLCFRDPPRVIPDVSFQFWMLILVLAQTPVSIEISIAMLAQKPHVRICILSV